MADYDLRALIHLLSPARALKEEIENERKRAEELNGKAPAIGNMAVRNANGLINRAINITGDEYLESLLLEPSSDPDDSQTIPFVKLALAQLIAYIEGQVGIPSQSSQVINDNRGNVGSIKISGETKDIEPQIQQVLKRVLGENTVASMVEHSEEDNEEEDEEEQG